MPKKLALSILLTTLLVVPTELAAEPICDTPEARQFDFWIGEWNVVNKRLHDDGTWVEMGRAAAKVYPILGGCALVEHWRGMAWDQKTIGFSVRAFDPRNQKWFLLLTWPAKDRPGFGTLEGAFSHGRGEFFQRRQNPDGAEVLTRYSFSDARSDALRWDAAQSKDGGRSWSTYWIMEFSRRDPWDLPLFHGPWIADGRDRHCGQEEAAQLDFLAGGWEGIERRGGAERPARAMIYPILEGCALMDFVEVEGEESGASFAIRVWEAREQQWVQYEMNTQNPIFVKSAGQVGDDGAEFVGGEDGAQQTRVRWHRDEGGRLLRTDDLSEDGGTSWSVVRELELSPASR